MRPTRRNVLRSIAAGTAAVAVGTGVAVADDDETADGDAKVRVAHASPDAPNVDVFVGENKVLADVPFTAVSGYLELPAGTYEVTIAAASDAEAPDEAETVAFRGEVTLEGDDYTVAAIGELTPDVSTESFRPAIFEDTLGVLDEETGRVRIVHASPDAPAVDVRVVDDDGDTVLTLADDIEFGEASANVEAPAGTYSVAVFPAGADETLDSAVYGPVDVEVRAGEVLTVFAEGFLTADPEFQPVLAYEDAAPFGGGPGGDGEAEGDEEEEDEEDEADDDDEDEDEEGEDDAEEADDAGRGKPADAGRGYGRGDD
ncbi:DUF4397 domain-containing protein [Halomicroarcula sp. F13]|uniref:DUF4397 domain-containing protein n=1 Tax=Haloarcula rubra TaxID=2487747 RepID=A0AAW4PR87_9EURY|nr:DUF4397 domain-containing protein [Halomicroarcula rubra]MBX0323642.1 DUF4397 domain-containing protein [Halomicroarcula rubra]